MKNKDEFYVGYLNKVGAKTSHTLYRFVWTAIVIVILFALAFAFSQHQFKNSSFEFTNETKITGVFHEAPYPMLRVEVAKNSYKNILLLGFGKSSVNPYLQKLKTEVRDINGLTLSIEGNLIYYNGKTLIQITDEEKIYLANGSKTKDAPQKHSISTMTLQGEIIDPKCYFGVMKPGRGKIHRSCAVRCISGGIPPVLATTDHNNISQYYLITDMDGNGINESILSFVGKPLEVKGNVQKIDDWNLLSINPEDIILTKDKSSIY